MNWKSTAGFRKHSRCGFETSEGNHEPRPLNYCSGAALGGIVRLRRELSVEHGSQDLRFLSPISCPPRKKTGDVSNYGLPRPPLLSVLSYH